jgi:cell division protein FtsZ
MNKAEKNKQVIQIKVIGVGNGGLHTVTHMISRQVLGAEFICADTDAQALARCGSCRTLQLGVSGLGAANPSKGHLIAESSVDQIRKAIDGAQMLIIIAGMSGGTGTGAAPVIARVGKEMGILTVGLMTTPGDWVTGKRMRRAEAGLAELEPNVDSLIVLSLGELFEIIGDDHTENELFTHANDLMSAVVGGIAGVINVPGQMSFDFNRARSVIGRSGIAMMGTAVTTGPDRARIATERALACPLLKGNDLSGVKNVLVLVAAAKGSLELSESAIAMDTVKRSASPDANVICGSSYDDSLGEDIRVTVVAIGSIDHCPIRLPARR